MYKNCILNKAIKHIARLSVKYKSQTLMRVQKTNHITLYKRIANRIFVHMNRTFYKSENISDYEISVCMHKSIFPKTTHKRTHCFKPTSIQLNTTSHRLIVIRNAYMYIRFKLPH